MTLILTENYFLYFILQLFFLPALLACKFFKGQDDVFMIIFWDPGLATAVDDVLGNHSGSDRMNERDRVPDLRSTGLIIEADDCFTGLEIQI